MLAEIDQVCKAGHAHNYQRFTPDGKQQRYELRWQRIRVSPDSRKQRYLAQEFHADWSNHDFSNTLL